jgi:hypothetical protein
VLGATLGRLIDLVTPTFTRARFLLSGNQMSTSNLQKATSSMLSDYFAQYVIRENHRPEWMDGLELDFYIEDLNTAIEVQGQQHYEWIEHFHKTFADFQALQCRDEKKRNLCDHMGIALHYVHDLDELIEVAELLAGISFVYPLHPNAAASIIKAEIENLYHTMLCHNKRIRGYCSSIKKFRQQSLRTKSPIEKINLGRAIEKRMNKIRKAFFLVYSQEHIEWFIGLI